MDRATTDSAVNILSVRQCILFTLLYLLLSELASFLLHLFSGTMRTTHLTEVPYLRFIIGPLLIGLVLYIIFIKTGYNPKRRLLLVRERSSTFVFDAMITIVSCLFFIICNALSFRCFGIGYPKLFMLPQNSSEAVLAVGVIGVIAPVLEELLFRGLFLQSFLVCFSKQKAVLLSVLLFIGAHLSITRMIPLLIIGLITSLVYIKTKSIYAAIIAHVTWNLTMIIASLF